AAWTIGTALVAQSTADIDGVLTAHTNFLSWGTNYLFFPTIAYNLWCAGTQSTVPTFSGSKGGSLTIVDDGYDNALNQYSAAHVLDLAVSNSGTGLFYNGPVFAAAFTGNGAGLTNFIFPMQGAGGS